MIGGDDDAIVCLCQLTEQVGNDGVTEPRECDGTVSRLVIGQFAYHLRLRTSVAEHIDEVEYHHVQVVLLQCVQLLYQFFCFCRRIDLMIREGVLSAIALQLCLDEWCLVEVLAFLLVLVDPQVRKHLGYLVWHQT